MVHSIKFFCRIARMSIAFNLVIANIDHAQ
jgi:hypothetical protein